MRAPFDCRRTGSVDNERVDRHAPPSAPARDDHTRRLVPEDQGRGAARVVAVIGVHIRAADADRLDLDEHLVRGGYRIGSSR